MSALSRAVPFHPGDLFADRYRVRRLLGEGGMGTVYEVIDERLDERVALKIMRFDAGTEEDVARFQREVRLARRITHPHVARTHDIGEHEGLHFLTMELIDGDSLDDVIESRRDRCVDRRGPFTPTEAVELAIQMAEGLGAAHAANVVHRDLKPPNLIVVPGDGSPAAVVPGPPRLPRLAITDFGVARASDGPANTTRTVGTPLYMAPEQLLGEAVGPAADLYAFGVVLYEMLTGRLPFEGGTPMAVALARCRVPPEDPRVHVDLPSALADLVLACLRMSPPERPVSAIDVAAALRGFARAASAKTVVQGEEHAKLTATSGSVSAPFAPISPGKRALAVLPFEYRGSPELEFLGESLAQELVDTLSRTRGLRVFGFGAARGHASTGDPRDIGRALGADSIVAGTVQGGAAASDGGRVRVSVRLIEVATGVQIWSARFDKRFEDVMEMQDIVSQRVAEALRMEVNLREHRGQANPEAVELYLRARGSFDQRFHVGALEVVTLLERALALEPDFPPAVALHAMACIQAWWVDVLGLRRTDWAVVTRNAVERALAVGPDLAESHLAAAMYALHVGDLRKTALELANTLEIAPTMALAHRYLADMQCEAGRPAEGLKRARLALELDPSLHTARFVIARHHALAGDREACMRELDVLVAAMGIHHTPILSIQMRFALWFDELDRVLPLLEEIRASNNPMHMLITQFAGYATGELDRVVLERAIAFAGSLGNARLVALFSQLLAEAQAYRRDWEGALLALEAASHTALVDVAWLERCPLFASLRSEPRFMTVVATVRERAADIWQVPPHPGSQ